MYKYRFNSRRWETDSEYVLSQTPINLFIRFMNLKLVLVILWLTILGFYNLSAQDSTLLKDKAFFEKQLPEYVNWLNYHKLSDLLQVYALEVYDSDSITLKLDLVYEQLDSSLNAWKNAKESFAKKNYYSLEEYLFYQLTFLLEVEPEHLRIEIYISLSPHLFNRAQVSLYYENDKFKRHDPTQKSQLEDIKLPPIRLQRIGHNSSTLRRIRGLNPSENYRYQIHQKIIEYAQEYFINEKEAQLDIQEGEDETDTRLRMRVTELKRDVLTDEANPILAQVLNLIPGLNIDWVKREMLEFNIFIDDKKKELYIILRGKYGNGIWKPRLNAYRNMEPHFIEYLKKYGYNFRKKLQRKLKDLN